jgi:hypothetical protein
MSDYSRDRHCPDLHPGCPRERLVGHVSVATDRAGRYRGQHLAVAAARSPTAEE